MSVSQSLNLPTGGEREFDLGLPHRKIECGLPSARGGSDAIGVEQLEDAAFAGVVADLRDPLNLCGAVYGFGTISFSSGSPLKDGLAKRDDLPAQNETE